MSKERQYVVPIESCKVHVHDNYKIRAHWRAVSGQLSDSTRNWFSWRHSMTIFLIPYYFLNEIRNIQQPDWLL